MSIVVATAALCAGLVVWWLLARQLTARPWEGQGTFDGREVIDLRDGPGNARTGLWVFLAVVSSFFVLFMTAYLMRMSPQPVQGVALRDWRPLAEPSILWLNTLLLVIASVGMQFASHSLHRGHFAAAAKGLLAGGLFAAAFLAGQWLAWRQLQAAGVYANGNPANAFFYVLTALHGVHLLGGLVVWTYAVQRMARGSAGVAATVLSVQLCTTYWHYLLAVWVVLFGLLLVT